jgi:hypothetical protein
MRLRKSSVNSIIFPTTDTWTTGQYIVNQVIDTIFAVLAVKMLSAFKN